MQASNLLLFAVSVTAFAPPSILPCCRTAQNPIPPLSIRPVHCDPSSSFQRICSCILHVSEQESSDDETELQRTFSDESPSTEEFVDDSLRQRLTQKYTISSVLFAIVAAWIAIMPDRTNTVKLATKVGGAAGYGLASGVSFILAGATDRLRSNTMKRLNCGLFVFSFISIFAIPGESAFHPKFGSAMLLLVFMGIVKGYGMKLAYQGWTSGVRVDPNKGSTPQQIVVELLKGTKSTLGALYNTPRTGFAYLQYLVFSLFGTFSALMSGIFCMQYHAPLFEISLHWSAIARLSLVSAMIFSLKDASERGRLTEITFIQLNLMVGLWALAVGIGQGTGRLGFSLGRTPMLMCSVPFLYEAIRSRRKKSKVTIPSSPE